MKHADAEPKPSAADRPSDIPALLVPGGSRSSLCRARTASRAVDEAAAQWFYCTDSFWNAAKEEWDKLGEADRFEIERNGIATLVDRLRTLYEIGEDEALARINAINVDMNRRAREPAGSGHRRSAASAGAGTVSKGDGSSSGEGI